MKAVPPVRLVVVESPYSGDVKTNVAYARRCVVDCLARGEAPIASHLLFTQPGILDDTDEEQRGLGIACGHAWISRADAVVVYSDRGVSLGMQSGIICAERMGVPVEYREIGT